MQNCRDVAYLLASDGVEEVDWPRRLRTRLHLLYCKHCRRYANELAMIGRAGREALSADSLDPKMLRRLERSIMGYASDGDNESKKDVPGDGGEATHS